MTKKQKHLTLEDRIDIQTGISQQETFRSIAEKIGVAQAQQVRLENGGRNRKDETLERMAEIFGVSFYYFKCSDDNVDILRKVELTDKQKLEMYYLIKKYLKM